MSILIKPIITEKMTAASDEFNRYGFIVDRNANKIQIKGAVEEAYGVTVNSVKTMNYAGKSKVVSQKLALLLEELVILKKLLYK